jgi:hypothetical protein
MNTVLARVLLPRIWIAAAGSGRLLCSLECRFLRDASKPAGSQWDPLCTKLSQALWTEDGD